MFEEGLCYNPIFLFPLYKVLNYDDMCLALELSSYFNNIGDMIHSPLASKHKRGSKYRNRFLQNHKKIKDIKRFCLSF